MIPKPLDKIEAADILALVTNADEERRTMDFKRDLPGNADKDKNELRADVTSFANAGGGDLIFGVDEKEGVAADVPGLPGVNIDDEIRRIEAVIQSSIDPRVPGFESRAILIPGKGSVIVVRVPKSWRGPHLVKINDTFRMFGRNSKGKYIFDATEIRSAFALSAELPERIRRWRDDRLAKIIGGEAPVRLAPGAKLILHLVPVSSFAKEDTLSVGQLVQRPSEFMALGVGGWNTRVNFDGFLTHSGESSGDHGQIAYCQAFRSGRIESVCARLVREIKGRNIIASIWYEKTVIDATTAYLHALKSLQVPMPCVALLAIHGAKGAEMGASNMMWMGDMGPIDRDLLLLPDVLFESYEQDVARTLRPAFDAVWNACGWPHSVNYNAKGEWAPPR